jgi:hypothetical protein
MLHTGAPILYLLIVIAAITPCGQMAAYADENAPRHTSLQRIAPSGQTGQAYRLIYTVNVPLAVFWKFKTDFGGNFLATHRYILSNRLVSRQNHVYITETRYADAPQTAFLWQTTVTPSDHRLEYRLLNPEECGQRFNHGTIQISTFSGVTRVEHSTYFDFFGATLWVGPRPRPGRHEGFPALHSRLGKRDH